MEKIEDDEMGQIARDNRQLTLIYSSNTRVGTHTLSYLTPLEDKLLAIDLAKTKVADTQWVEIAATLNCKVGDLVDKRILDMDEASTSEFGTEDWIKIINHNDEVITQPIAINGDKMMQVTNPPEVMRFFEVDSAGLEKTFHGDEPTIQRTTEDENFIE